MRGHQQRAFVTLEKLLQPDQAFQVEVVARLVQQHGVGTHQENARQRDAHLPAAGQRADIAVHHLQTEAQAGEDFAGPRLQGIAVEFLEPRLHLAVAGDDVVHVASARRIRHGGLEFLQLDRHRAHGACAIHHLGHRAAAGHLADILAEIADGDAAIDGDLALVGLLFARDHPEKRGFAGAVGADQAGLLPLLQRRRGFDEENLVAMLLADVVETDHWHPGKRNRCGPLMPCGATLEG